MRPLWTATRVARVARGLQCVFTPTTRLHVHGFQMKSSPGQTSTVTSLVSALCLLGFLRQHQSDSITTVHRFCVERRIFVCSIADLLPVRPGLVARKSQPTALSPFAGSSFAVAYGRVLGSYQHTSLVIPPKHLLAHHLIHEDVARLHVEAVIARMPTAKLDQYDEPGHLPSGA